MYRDEILARIEDLRELGLPDMVRRSGALNQVELMVSTVIGARRSGKSFRALQAAADMIGTKHLSSLRHVCHLDFDNPILADMTAAELLSVPEVFLSVTPDATLKTPLLFIFDEIHVVKNWERFVISLSRNPAWTVVVTGSSSRLLRHNVATELRGKAIPTEVYPLSFSEFLAFKNVVARRSATGVAAVRAAFDDFLKWGAYPAVARTEERLREPLLREYFDTMILKDIIQRHDLSKPRQCVHLYRYLLSCIGRPATPMSAYRFLRTAGASVGRESVTEWINWATDAWLFFMVPVYSDSLKAQELNYKKLYAIDWALAHVNSRTWDGSVSRSLENAVYLHLARAFPKVNYVLTRDKRLEVDFVATDSAGKPRKLVQVCLSIREPTTLARELAPLAASARYLGTRDNVIVTMDEERTFTAEGVPIRAVPAWKWLLE